MTRIPIFLRSHAFGLTALLLMSACQAPDVRDEIKAFAAAEEAVHNPLKKVLDANLAAARAARIDSLIGQEEPIYELGPGCRAVTSVPQVGQPCVPVDKFVHDERMIQLELAKELLASLKAYIDAISLLAGSKAPEEIAASIPALTSDIKALTAAVEDADLKEAGATIDGFSSALAIVAKMGTEGARAATLRRVVEAGDSAVEDAVFSLISVLEDIGHTRFQALFYEASAADNALRAPEVMGNAARHRAAVTRFEKATAALNEENQRSLAGQLMAVRRTHAALLARLSAGASLDEILQFTKELAQLRAAIDAAKG